MFPWVYDFRWTAGHLTFLGVFFSAVMVAATTVSVAIRRSRRDLARGQAGRILWRAEFEGLPEMARRCRHSFKGELPGRICSLAFDCRECVTHAKLATVASEEAADLGAPAGLRIWPDRLYHRGHTWVKLLENGYAMVGLDDLARRLLGRSSTLELPGPGTALEVNLPAWKVLRNGSEVSIAAPIDGTVVDAASCEPWVLKVVAKQPVDVRHLLRGNEVSAWLTAELERLQLLASGREGTAALADGGVLLEDLAETLPPDEWERVCGEMLLEG
jgi:glycine cleavage system H lipoate-binding protein